MDNDLGIFIGGIIAACILMGVLLNATSLDLVDTCSTYTYDIPSEGKIYRLTVEQVGTYNYQGELRR